MRRAVARKLLAQVLDVFLPAGEVVIGIDDTIERRWGARIKARGIYRDPVRSSHGHFVKASGLRWLSLMVIVPIPWAGRRWALPFLTVLAPSERWSDARGRRHKKLTDWARQAILQAKHWLPNRRVIIVADSSFAALDLIAAVRRHVCLVTRLRLDARLFAPAPARQPGQLGRPRLKGRRACRSSLRCWPIPGPSGRRSRCRSGTAASSARWRSFPAWRSGITPACRRRRSAGCWCAIPPGSSHRRRSWHRPRRPSRTKSSAGSSRAGAWKRRSRKSRAHLGVETQRQWSDLAILRTTPALLGLFSLVTIWTHGLSATRRRRPPANGRLVRQARPDLQRRHRHRPTRPLVPAEFMDVPANQGDHRNPCNPAAKTHRDSLSRCIKKRKILCGWTAAAGW